MPDSIDLNNITKNPEYNVEVKPREEDDERQSRLQREEAREQLQRWRDTWMFRIGASAVVIVGAICLWMSVDLRFTADQQKWGQAIITSMITAVLGYLVGRGGK